MRVLITGAKGYVGSHLVPALEEHHAVLAIDREDGDLTEPGVFSKILGDYPCEVVIHLAAMPGREFCEHDKMGAVVSNTGMTALVAEACDGYNTRLCYVSTSEVYGRIPSPPAVEDDLCQPHNIYGITKLAGEKAAELYAPEGLLILRPSMCYSGDMPTGFGRAALPTMIRQALDIAEGRSKERLVAHRNCWRSWTYIEDIISGMVAAIERGQGIFNVGRGGPSVSMGEIANLACGLVDIDPHRWIRYEDPPPTVTPVKRPSDLRLRSIGWEPRVSLKEGMERTLEELKASKAP